MKHYKQFKEINGIQLKNIQFFPSSEWGDEGGFSFDIYFHGKQIGNLFNAGDGGEEEVHLDLDEKETQDFYNLVKKSVPSVYYDKKLESYKSMGKEIYNQYKDLVIEDRDRTVGKQEDLISFMCFCETIHLFEKKKKVNLDWIK